MNNKNYMLNPNWITGLVDAEGSFNIRFTKSKYHKSGWYIQACFQIALHVRDKNLLLQIKTFFNETGNIYVIKDKAVLYQVRDLSAIQRVVIPHFEKYSLITQKQSDFILFKKIVKLMGEGKHLNKESLIDIIKLRASLNKGLPDKLKIHFMNIKIERPKIITPVNIDYNWVAGFFTGESCFFIDICKSKTNKIGYSTTLRVLVGQHLRDKILMNYLISIIGCGNVLQHSNVNAVILSISKFEDIYSKVIPMLHKYKIGGIKLLDFQDFCEAAELNNKKAHLTLEGLEQIRVIKFRMNRKRYIT